MALLRIDARSDVPHLADGRAPWDALAAHLAPLPQGTPLVIGTHGLRHSPFGEAWDPYSGLLAYRRGPAPHWKARSLIRRLHMAEEQRLDGHAIAFGWNASGLIWPAMVRARGAGRALARLTTAIRERRPDLRIGAVTHSLGARVVIEAMLHAPVPAFDRVLLLTPADHRGRAARALTAPGGMGCTVVATQTPENWLCAMGFAAAVPGLATLARGPLHPRWVDFVPDRLPQLGVAGWNWRTCHWSCYLRPGLWPLYRAWLTGEARAAMFAAPARAGLQSWGGGPRVAETA